MNTPKHIPSRKPLRIKDYDFSKPGYYFITLLAKGRQHLFGSISKGIMQLNDFGRIVEEGLINMLTEKYSNSKIDYFTIMPNHIHFILIINDCKGEVTSPLPKLENIIAFYKYQTTKHINQIRKTPGAPVWHRNYFEHIIQNDLELFEIRKYIDNNPVKWDYDEYK
jgi:putative transposase